MTPATPTVSREVEELIARCEALMVMYHGSPRREKDCAEMASEVHEVARLAGALGLTAEDIDRTLVTRVRAGMLERFGSRPGAVMFSAFHTALLTQKGP